MFVSTVTIPCSQSWIVHAKLPKKCLDTFFSVRCSGPYILDASPRIHFKSVRIGVVLLGIICVQAQARRA